MINQIIQALLTMSITGTILGVAFLLVKPIISTRIPKFAQYYSLLLIIVAFLIPFSLIITLPEKANNITTHTVNETVKQYIVPSDTELSQSDDVSNTSVPAESTNQTGQTSSDIAQTLSTTSIFLIIWLIGVVSYLMYNLWGYLSFVRNLKANSLGATSEEIAALAELSDSKRKPLLIKSSLAQTPMLIGIIKPTIILPNKSYSEISLKYILLHELTHHRRYDIIVKWLSVVANALHWFNPAVYLVRREIGKMCELACDEAVIRNSDINSKQEYGNTIISVAAERKLPKTVLSTTMNEDKKVLKERLGSIKTSKKTTKTKVVISAVLLVAVLCTAVILGASVNKKDDSWAKQFPSDLAANGFLSKKIVDALPRFEKNKGSDGQPSYYWSDWDDEKKDVIHKIEMTEQDDVLIAYQYKSYYFDVPNLDSSLSKDEGANMVEKFAEKYIPDYETLSFRNEPSNHTLYDPKHVELWFADRDDKHYTVAVDLDMGAVISYEMYESESATIETGIYRLKSEPKDLGLTIKDNESYEFANLFMSYHPPKGNYRIDGNELVLLDSDINRYHFEVKGNSLVYSEATSYIENEMKPPFDQLEDGMVFVLDDESSTASYTYLENFPDVIDIVSYVNQNPESINILYSSKNEIGFSFLEPIDTDETANTTIKYAKLLESQGYELTGYDATISSTIELKSEKYIIKITSISDLDEYKKVHTEVKNIDKITDTENVLFQLEKVK